jgi:hypothetical protein
MNHIADPTRREAILAAMQDRLDWLREHKDAPLWHWGNELLVPASRSEVNAIAVNAAQMPEERAECYRVTVQFGAGVSYVARAESARAMVAAGGAA